MKEQILLTFIYLAFPDDLPKNQKPKVEHDLDKELHIGNELSVEER